MAGEEPVAFWRPSKESPRTQLAYLENGVASEEPVAFWRPGRIASVKYPTLLLLVQHILPVPERRKQCPC